MASGEGEDREEAITVKCSSVCVVKYCAGELCDLQNINLVLSWSVQFSAV